MKQKNWIKQYGIHLLVCVAAISIAFEANRRIVIEKSHVYTISEPIYTLLKEITEIKTEGNTLLLSGWCFDTAYYNENSTCELILQDTQTGEAVWPKMEKNPESVEVVDCYTNGEDYAGAGFEGSLQTDKLKEDSVYEILLRYTSEDGNGAEKKHPYIKTVTTDTFLYQGKATGYNPKTFIAPEVEGTELEKVVSDGNYCYFSEDGMYIYEYNNAVYYIADPGFYFAENGLTELPLHIFPVDTMVLEEKYFEAGFENRDILFESYEIFGNFGKYRVAVKELPDNYTIAYITTGHYLNNKDGWAWKKVVSMVGKNE